MRYGKGRPPGGMAAGATIEAGEDLVAGRAMPAGASARWCPAPRPGLRGSKTRRNFPFAMHAQWRPKRFVSAVVLTREDGDQSLAWIAKHVPHI